MQLVLVALCALLGCAFTQECDFSKFQDLVHMRHGALPAPLSSWDVPDMGACRARCCEHAPCDTAVLQRREDGHARCHLLHCGGRCEFHKDDQWNVSAWSGEHAPGKHAPGGLLHAEPMMLGASTRTDEKNNNNNNNNNNNSSDVCALPRVVGVCKAAFPRFFFNATSGSCQRFIYGGCGSNGNNFKTQDECEKKCGGNGKGFNDDERPSENDGKTLRMAAVPLSEWSQEEDDTEELQQAKEMSEEDFRELCMAPPVVGPCRAAFPRWFYNSSASRCQRFLYGGCKGNKNNHQSEEQCTSSCTGVKLLHSKKMVPVLTDDDYSAQCEAAPETGMCRGYFPMFFFNPESQSCEGFVYGGCHGNANRYATQSECEERCIYSATAEGRGKARNRWTTAFFLFLALAAVSFLLLTSLIFINMRRNRAPRHALSIRSDKEGLLPDSERSSVDSLPLPESPTTG